MKHFLLFYIKSASHLEVAFDKAEWRLDLAGGNLNLIPPALAVSYGPSGRAGSRVGSDLLQAPLKAGMVMVTLPIGNEECVSPKSKQAH